MLKLRILIPILVFGCLSTSVAFAGPAVGDSCPWPYDTMYYVMDSANLSFTEAEAKSICSDALSSTLPLNFDAQGYVLFWVGDAPASGESGRFTCYACVSNYIPDPFEEKLNSKNTLKLETALTIVGNLYQGEATHAKRFVSFDAETGEAGSSFIFTLNNVPAFDGGLGVVHVDPESGECVRLHPFNSHER